MTYGVPAVSLTELIQKVCYVHRWSYPGLLGLSIKEKIWCTIRIHQLPSNDSNTISNENSNFVNVQWDIILQYQSTWPSTKIWHNLLKFLCLHPQQNEIVEQKNKHLLEVASVLMFTTNMPKMLWGNANLTATECPIVLFPLNHLSRDFRAHFQTLF